MLSASSGRSLEIKKRGDSGIPKYHINASLNGVISARIVHKTERDLQQMKVSWITEGTISSLKDA